MTRATRYRLLGKSSLDNFNPYAEWLGLDRQIGQPDYFQLLQLSKDVTDAAEISHAADRAMVQVRGHKPGKNAKYWAQLLDELESAKSTLTDPQQRQSYLQQLKKKKTSVASAKPGGTKKSAAAGRRKKDAGSPAPTATKVKTRSARQQKPAQSTSKPKPKSAESAPASADPKPTPTEPGPTPAVVAPVIQSPQAAEPPSADPMAPVDTVRVAPASHEQAPVIHPPAADPVVLTPAQPAVDAATPPASAAPQTPAPQTLDPMAPVEIPMSHLASQASPAPAPTAAVEPMPGSPAPVLGPAGTEAIPTSAAPDAIATDSAAVAAGADDGSTEPAKPMFDLIGDDYPRGGKGKNLLIGGAVALVALIAVGGVLWQFSDAIFGRSDDGATQVAEGPGNDNLDHPKTGGTGGTNSGTDVDNAKANSGNNGAAVDQSGTGTGTGTNTGTGTDTDSGTNTPDTDTGDASTGADDNGDNTTDGTGSSGTVDDGMPDDNSMGNDSSTGSDVDEPMGGDQTDTDDTNSSGPTRAEIVELGQRMAAIRTLLYERNIEEAAAQIDSAQAIPRTEDHDAVFNRLVQIADLVTQFWQAVEDGAAQLQSGEELKYSETTIVIIVESQPGRITYRLGENVTRAPREMPPGLAVLIADKVLSGRGSEGRMIKGAIYAIESEANPTAADKAISIWEEAALLGAMVEPLIQFLDDDYDLASSIVEQGPMPDPAELGSALDVVRTRYRDQYREATSAPKRIELAEFLVSEAAKTESAAERFVIFEEAIAWAARAGDSPLVLDSVTQLGRWFELEDELTRKIDAIVTAAKATGGIDAAKESARTALELAEEAQGSAAEDRIEDLLTAAMGASRRTRDRDFQQTVRRRVDEIREAMSDE